MKHRYSFITGLLVLFGAFVPSLTAAATITPPNNTVAISEATYHALKKAHCYAENAPATAMKVANGAKCDPVIAKYDGKIVMRVQGAGQMYVVNTGDGYGPLLKTYTQGIYRVGGKYFYVNNGFYKQLSSTRPDKTIFGMARAKHSGVKMITKSQFNLLFGKGGNATEAAAAKVVQQAFKGYVVNVTDDQGKLYYVPTNVEDGENPVRINGKLRNTIKDASNTMSSKALSQMVKE